MTQRIFISYRRQDSRGDAGRIYDRLRPEFGETGLFMDVAHIPLGVNFVRVLREEVAKCHVLLAVIGPGWLEARDDDGSRRLDNPNDFVRVEIAAALTRDIPVIPILLEGTRMPKASALSADLQELALRNALDVRHVSFHSDMDRLIAALRKLNGVRIGSQHSQLTSSTPVSKSMPSVEEVLNDAGNWIRQFNVRFLSPRPPQEFGHHFILIENDDSSHVQPGAIVVGSDWNANPAPTFRIEHGYVREGPILHCSASGLTYLGPIWRSEYAKLSDDVFKRLGGKPLAHFIKHP